jgi:hypothetical protein
MWLRHSDNERLRSALWLKSVPTPQIGIHWHHYLKSWCCLRVFSNQLPFHILRSYVQRPRPLDHIYMCNQCPASDLCLFFKLANRRPFSNSQLPFHILRSMGDLLVSVRVRARVRVRAYVSDVIGRRFEKEKRASLQQATSILIWHYIIITMTNPW